MKTFKECPFKLHLPTCVTFDKTAEFKCKFVFGENKLNTIFSEARLINIFKETSQVDVNMPLTIDKASYTLVFSVKGEKSIFLKKSTLILSFLHEDGKKTIVSYLYNESKVFELNDVSVEEMTDSDKVIYYSAIMTIDPIDDGGNKNGEMNRERYSGGLLTGLKPYFDALSKEKKFLMSEGGRKYKVTKGRYIGKVDSKYSYVFDLETELFMSEDAPIVLCIGIDKYPGSVLMCEDFQMVVVLSTNLGSNISSAYINVEPWKLLDALADRVYYGLNHNDKMIRELFNGTKLATNEPIENISKGQDAVINRALNEPVTIVWGPPGTGKTYTMAELAIHFLAQKKEVLVVSHSNVSVDGITKQIGKIFRDKNQEYILKRGLVLRYGYVRDEELRNDECLNSFAFAVSKDKSIKLKLDSLQKEAEKIKAISGVSSPKLTEIHKKIKEIKAVIKKEEEKCVQNAYVVAATISKAIIDDIFKERLFDVVIFDEVSMAYVLQIMSAATFAKEHMICVGDFMQLSPIVQSDAAKLEEDIFDFMGINVHGKPYYHPWLIMLDEQRRMHPAISEFSNDYVYKKLLKDHSSVIEGKKDIVKQEMFPGKPINMIDLQTTYCASTKNSDNSRYNILSGLISFSIALRTEENVETTSVITPYAAQTRLIRALILDYKKERETSLRCATVHQFQGSESDVVIFDAVESYPGLKPGWLMSKDPNSVKRLINVAVTRARGKLAVVANKRFWDDNYKEKTNHTFYRLINYLSQSGNVVQHMGNKSLERMVSNLSVKGGPKYYMDNSYIEDLLNDIRKAKERIIISLPSGQLDENVEKNLYDELMMARKKGIKTLVKSNNYAALPDYWKVITWGTDNAIFPLIMVDDRIVWYGAPFASWKFALKNGVFLSTLCKIACRVKGEHTTEIIRSLSDLDYRETAAGKAALTEKDEKKKDDGVEPISGGLVEYASHLHKCPKCGQYMKMTKGKSGKTILGCKKCYTTSLLSIGEINHYIGKYNVKCPEHRCDIEAKLGMYGLYIKCDHGHTLKPEAI